MLLQFLLTCCFLGGVLAVWFFFSGRRDRRFRRSGASARVKGACGDHMELRLVFCDGRLEQARQWVNGCAWSHLCLSAAVAWAKGKTPLEMLDLDAGEIRRRVRDLPADHVHCAVLAAATLQEAVENFLRAHPAALDSEETGATCRRCPVYRGKGCPTLGD